MSISIPCRELGLDCLFEHEGDSEESVIESLIRHVQVEHEEEWFGIEEIYQAARVAIRTKAA
jgi:predicted small metal-binding protein